MIGRFILHAPNVHVGGGLHLLMDLLVANESLFSVIQLDKRIKRRVSLRAAVTNWVDKSVVSRFIAEWKLYRQCTPSDTVLCFHGLPPLFPLKGHVVVFVQNRILFERTALTKYPLLTRSRLNFERFWVRTRGGNCDQYFVQTPSMANAVREHFGTGIPVAVKPFMSQCGPVRPESENVTKLRSDGFVYVASGEPHKNHASLLEAWRLLSDEGLRPGLTLTVCAKQYPAVSKEISRYVRDFSLNIENVGHVSRERVHDLYRSASALIFPSMLESFGMPLIEAARGGLPVLAPELDYVRDVVVPKETFDPNSPISIARAVKRFLGVPDPVAEILSAKEFLVEVRRCGS